MTAAAETHTESPTPSHLRDLLEQLIGMIEGWDMGESPPSRQPVPPLDDYLKQCGALDAQGQRINSPETHQLINHWFKLEDEDIQSRRVKDTQSDPSECWPLFEALATQIGNTAHALGWPRPIKWRFLGLPGQEPFDPRKVLPIDSQVSRHRIVEVYLPPPAQGHFEHVFDVEMWLPYPRPAWGEADKWPPSPKIAPFRNELWGHLWAMKNDKGKPQFLEMLRGWKRFAETQTCSARPAPSGERQEEIPPSPGSPQPPDNGVRLSEAMNKKSIAARFKTTPGKLTAFLNAKGISLVEVTREQWQVRLDQMDVSTRVLWDSTSHLTD